MSNYAFDVGFQATLNRLREAVRRKSTIGRDGALCRVVDMDDSKLIRTYRISRRWYQDVCAKSDQALNAVYDHWKALKQEPDWLRPDDFDIPECCFEKEVEYVLEMVETARQYLLCLQREVKKRKLEPVLKQMSKPFACGRRGWNAHHPSAAH